MSDDALWFASQLRSSGDAVLWAYDQLPPTRRLETPPDADSFGDWPAARHLWHLAEYERCLAAPAMRLWLGGAMPTHEDMWDESDAGWAAASLPAAPDVVRMFRAARAAQAEVLDALASADWQTPRPTPWGERSLQMIVTKTLQHSFSHADTLLRMVLWWDDIVRRDDGA